MRRSSIPLLIVAIFFFWDGNVYSQQHQAGIVQTIYFSPLPLKQYERIWKIEAELSCGHFSHFINTPEDWSLAIIRPISSRLLELFRSAGRNFSIAGYPYYRYSCLHNHDSENHKKAQSGDYVNTEMDEYPTLEISMGRGLEKSSH